MLLPSLVLALSVTQSGAPDAAECLARAREALAAPQALAYRAELSMQAGPGMRLDAQAEVLLGPAGASSEEAFARPFAVRGSMRVQGVPQLEDAGELPFTAVFDGEISARLDAPAQRVFKDRPGPQGFAMFEEYSALLTGVLGGEGLAPEQGARTRTRGSETVEDVLCDVVEIETRRPGVDPDDPGGATLRVLTLWIAREDGLVRREEHSVGSPGEPAEAAFRVRLEARSLRRLETVPADAFALEVPAGWEVVGPPPERPGEESFALATGQVVPDFTLADAAGREHTLSALRDKVVLVDFWATWCGPCKRAMPHLQELHERYGAAGLVVIGVSNRDDGDPVAYMRDKGYTYLGLVQGDAVAEEWGVAGIPHFFLVGRDGKLLHQAVGFGDPAPLEARVREALGLPPGEGR